jgi:predicted SAM-dependent methyltransferase
MLSTSRALLKKVLVLIAPLSFWRKYFDEITMPREKYRERNLRRKYINSDNLLINYGAGSRGKPGWINVDAQAVDSVNCVFDCSKKQPFPNGSARGVFTEHFLEHIDFYETAPFFLSECFRVLKPGGTIRIIVPDAGRYLNAYSTNGWEEIEKLRGLLPGYIDPYFCTNYETKMEVVNMLFRQFGEHKFAYDFETIRLLLTKTGFSNINQTKYGISRDPILVIDQQEREHESLYVEATKPFY